MSADELEILRSLRADVGVLDPAIDRRIRDRITAGLAAATAAPSAADPDATGAPARPTQPDRPAPRTPDEFGLYAFDPTPSEADQRADTPATLRPVRGARSPAGRAPTGPGAPSQPSEHGDDWDIAGAPPARHLDPSIDRPRSAASGRSRASRVIALAAALVLLVAGGVAITRARTRDDRTAQVASDAAPLSVPELIALQRTQPPRPLGPGQYQYTHLQVGDERSSVDASGQAATQFITQDRQRWVATDGSGREVLGPEHARPFDDPAAATTDIGNAFDVPLRQPKGFAGFSYDELQTLPTEPAALRQRLLDSSAIGTSDRAGLARLVGQLLEQPSTPPAVRAGLVAVLEGEGLRSVGDRTDRLGRRGSGFELDAAGRRWTYIVDRATGRVVAWEQRVVDPAPGDPALVESDALALDGVAPPVTDNTGGS